MKDLLDEGFITGLVCFVFLTIAGIFSLLLFLFFKITKDEGSPFMWM